MIDNEKSKFNIECGEETKGLTDKLSRFGREGKADRNGSLVYL